MPNPPGPDIRESHGVSFGDSGVFEALGRDSRPRPSWPGIERRKRVSQDQLRSLPDPELDDHSASSSFAC